MKGRHQEAFKLNEERYVSSESVQLTVEEERNEYLTVNELF